MGKNHDKDLPVFEKKHDHHHHRKHALKRCLGGLGALLLTALILLGLAALIIWLVLRPIHKPTWAVEDVQVITLNVQNQSGGSRRLQTYNTSPLMNADLFFTLKATNPNKKMDVIYDKIDVSAAYATAAFGQTSIPPFTQGKANSTTVKTELKAMSVVVTPNLGSALQGDINSDSIIFQIYVDAKARMKIGSYKSFRYGVKATCQVSVTGPKSGRPGTMITKTCHT